MMINPKAKWLSLLLLASGIFLLGIYTQQWFYYFITMILAFYIRQKGYNTLFQEFDDKRKEKRLKIEKLLTEVKEKRIADRLDAKNKRRDRE